MNKKHFYTTVVLLLFLAIGIQTTRAIDIPTDTSVGTWDGSTYTLTTNVSEGLVIVGSNMILDGAGCTVTAPTYRKGQGIALLGETGVIIKNLTVQGFGTGIQLQSYSNGNIVKDNTISDNARGIQLHTNCDGNIVRDNTISGNNWGINLIALSNENIVTGNTIENNIVYGIILEQQSNNNKIYNNNFIENVTQASVSESTGNLFNLSAEEDGGNYWSTWATPDADGDGFVDSPYVIDIATNVKDYLPWVAQDGWLSPELLIQQLIIKVEELNGQYAINNSLDAKLQNALDAQEAKNAGQRQDAVNKMQAFINAVEAQSGNQIPEVEVADDLIACANYIISLL
ncbi:MAG: right-handed parallel beta-helix repeat-containing protein [Planctomycetota bacterium]|jgi:parallel beta-helix repeat protein